jgi:hypothetical protein
VAAVAAQCAVRAHAVVAACCRTLCVELCCALFPFGCAVVSVPVAAATSPVATHETDHVEVRDAAGMRTNKREDEPGSSCKLPRVGCERASLFVVARRARRTQKTKCDEAVRDG